MTVIAPSAQRLAEDNNVDWQLLEGSGEGGSVVEQDVLSYLARVMQGDEVTNPTPEPLPEGMSAWPEEAQRRRNEAAPKDLFASSFSTPTPPPAPLEAAPSPWTMPSAEPSVRAEPAFTTPSRAAFPEAASPMTASSMTPSSMTASPTTDSPTFTPDPKPSPPEADFAFAPAPAVTPEVSAAAPEAVPRISDGVPEEVHQRALAEVSTLKAQFAAAEEERLRYAGELRQLPQLHETVALQKNELTRLSGLQNEVQELRAQLATAQQAGKHADALAAQNQDLEARLERARIFRDEAKGEFDRLTALNVALEGKLAAPKRPWWRF